MSKSENNGTVPSAARLCHVIKQENFDGYGFNLHAEKGKPGQYIGKVDDGSPAEAAGLKQGDRILEVNGSSIFNETHKQVVQRIKAISNEVQLLVIDPSAPSTTTPPVSAVEQDKTVPDSSIKAEADTTKTSAPSSPVSNNKSVDSSASKSSTSHSPTNNISTTTSDHHELHHSGSKSNSETPTSSPHTSITAAAVPNHEANNSSGVISTATVSSANTSPSSSVNASATNNATSNSKSEGLNLNMTAAELRAKLAAKKKFDPKNESVDLRKKFEIIQKL